MYQIQRRSSRQWTPKTVTEMREVATDLLRHSSRQAWLLRGNLGSGKTTLVRAVLRCLGYRGVVASPTFTLSRHYVTPHKQWSRVLHVDAYRIRDLAEEAALDIQQALQDKNCLVLVEWPERLHTLYEWDPLTITIRHRKNGRFIIAQ